MNNNKKNTGIIENFNLTAEFKKFTEGNVQTKDFFNLLETKKENIEDFLFWENLLRLKNTNSQCELFYFYVWKIAKERLPIHQKSKEGLNSIQLSYLFWNTVLQNFSQSRTLIYCLVDLVKIPEGVEIAFVNLCLNEDCTYILKKYYMFWGFWDLTITELKHFSKNSAFKVKLGGAKNSWILDLVK